MDSAKAKVKEFLHSSGQHDTTVDKTTAPAVTNEQVTRTEHENVNAAINKEVHKDHYHTTVQPVKHAETLREQHHTNVVPVESRSFEHDNADDVKRNLAQEQARFKDEKRHVEGQRTTADAPIVSGEHRHHHVHETIQPVIEKQTVEPHVVHTVVPVHEKHHDVSQHHAGSTLPAISMDEFKNRSGTETATQHFKGEPQLSTSAVSGQGVGNTGTTGSSSTSGLDPATRAANVAGGTTGATGASQTGAGSDHTFGTMDGGSRTADSTTSAGKPSLMDKLNPRKDADGDGKAGLMK